MRPINKKIIWLSILLAGLLTFFYFFSRARVYDKNELEYGVTFSKTQVENLGLDWQKVFLSLFDELGVKKIRLSAYWNEVEKKENDFYWKDLDWQINAASSRDASIILGVGGRLPRWPECHYPEWTKNDQAKREEKVFNYIKKVVERYRNNKSIIAWQVENEPFLIKFGECPPLNIGLLDREIAFVKSLDNRPVVITDSGELSIWIPAAKRADIFGTTMYRDTYSQHLKRYIHYPIGPWFFKIKKNIAELFASPKNWIVIELAAEPWCPVPFQNTTEEERNRTMNLEKFKDIIEFARLTGFKEFYLWGAEWWYWEKEKKNNPALWEEAKYLFSLNQNLAKTNAGN